MFSQDSPDKYVPNLSSTASRVFFKSSEAGAQAFVGVQDMHNQFGQDLLQVEGLAGFQTHGGWVGGVGEEYFLINIQADADDGCREAVAGDLMLDKDAGDFSMLYIYIVRPFYGGFYPVALQETGEAQGDDFGDVELRFDREPVRSEEEGAGDVFMGFAFPFVVLLSASGGLHPRRPNGSFRRVGGMAGGVAVCRIDFGKPADHCRVFCARGVGQGAVCGGRRTFVHFFAEADGFILFTVGSGCFRQSQFLRFFFHESVGFVVVV